MRTFRTDQWVLRQPKHISHRGLYWRFVYLEVFELDLQIPFVVHVFLSQEDSVTVVAGLPKNLDGDLHVKMDLAFTTLLKYSTGRQQFSTMQQPLVTTSLRKFHRVF